MIQLAADGLYVVFRIGDGHKRDALGFAIKPKEARLFTEREGYWRGLCIGPFYVRTFKKFDTPRLITLRGLIRKIGFGSACFLIGTFYGAFAAGMAEQTRAILSKFM